MDQRGFSSCALLDRTICFSLSKRSFYRGFFFLLILQAPGSSRIYLSIPELNKTGRECERDRERERVRIKAQLQLKTTLSSSPSSSSFSLSSSTSMCEFIADFTVF